MKLKSTFTLISILSSAVVFGQRAELSFEDDVHKFNPVSEGAQLAHTFYFTNEGEVPLLISEYKVSCSCTKAIYPKYPIQPGDRDSVLVTFDTKGKIGWQYREVQLFSNDPKSPSEIEIRVKVKSN